MAHSPRIFNNVPSADYEQRAVLAVARELEAVELVGSCRRDAVRDDAGVIANGIAQLSVDEHLHEVVGRRRTVEIIGRTEVKFHRVVRRHVFRKPDAERPVRRPTAGIRRLRPVFAREVEGRGDGRSRHVAFGGHVAPVLRRNADLPRAANGQ